MQTVNRLFALTIFMFYLGYAQSQVIRGVVFDVETNQPVEGANIFIKDTYVGTVSDQRGRFTILWTGEYPITVQITFMGYKNFERTIHEPKNMMVALLPQVLEGEKVIVSGTRGLVEQEVQSKVESVSLRKIEQRGLRDISEVLQEMEAVTITTTEVGKQYISIRGSNFNEVSVYMDGVRLNRAIDGAANLAGVDISNLERVEVVRGGATTLFGPGNFGGVVLLYSKNPDKNRISFARTVGITEDSDQDLTGALTMKIGPLGLGGRYSGKSRLYDGRTLYTTIFNNVNSSADLKTSELSVRYLGLKNVIEFPSGAIISSDQTEVFQGAFSGSLLNTKSWYLHGGTRTWRWEDSFFSNISRDLTDESALIKLRKSTTFKNLTATLQYEEEVQSYAAKQFITDSYTAFSWSDSAELKQTDRGFAGVLNFQAVTPAPTIELFKMEVGMRRSSARYSHEQTIDEYIGPDLNKTVLYDFDSSVPLTTFRLGTYLEGQFQGNTIIVYFNQGYNQRAPTLNDRLLWGSTFEQTKDYYTNIEGLKNAAEGAYRATLENQLAELSQVIESMAEGLAKEYATTSEANAKLMLNMENSLIFSSAELGLGIFRSHYLDKIAYQEIQNNLIAPYNVLTAWLNGFEISAMLLSWNNQLQVNGSFTRIFPSDNAVFPNKPGSMMNLRIDLRKSWYHINLSHVYLGKQDYLRGGLSLQALDPQNSTNITVSVHKQIWLFNLSCSYAIRNLFSNESTVVQPDSGPFNYYESHRELLTFKLSFTEK